MELNSFSKIRHLKLKERNKLSILLSVNKSWLEFAGVLRNPDNKEEFLYTADDISILESQQRPADALLEHWSTSGIEQPNLNDLLLALEEANLLRAAHYVKTELLRSGTVEDEAVTEKLETVIHAVSQNDEYLHNISCISEKLQGIDLEDLALFPYDELSHATRNFCNLRVEDGGCKIGEGSYGSVYQAHISGVTVAVKQLKDPIDKQFLTELSILVRCKHENLLALLGFSINGPKCCLVYEYMVNGSLQEKLACLRSSPPLSSKSRLSIAYGSAIGINYLHTFGEQPMVHRDIKSANILLDANFVPKIGDFGLVRIGSSSLSSTVAVTENVYGTCVYMPREAFNGDVSVKWDTFSFGVVLLEILTGLPPYDNKREDRDLVTHMENCDDIRTMLDCKVEWNVECAVELNRIAKLCLAAAKKNRPTISEMLESLKRCCCGYIEIERWV